RRSRDVSSPYRPPSLQSTRRNGSRQESCDELHERSRCGLTLNEHVGSVGGPGKDLQLLRLLRPAVPCASSVRGGVRVIGRRDEELGSLERFELLTGERVSAAVIDAGDLNERSGVDAPCDQGVEGGHRADARADEDDLARTSFTKEVRGANDVLPAARVVVGTA